LLKTLGRVHSAAQAEKTYRILRDAGFDNVSIDLMFSVPGQTPDQWRATLHKTIALGPEHVSSYCLTYEEDTEYFRKLTGGSFQQDDERDAQLFEDTMDRLAAGGYAQYEISNYARPGRESRHNRAYWLGKDYLGFGPSGFSTVGGLRWENVRDTAEYTRRVLAGKSPALASEVLTSEQRAGEIAAFRMRMSEGMPVAELSRWGDALAEFERIALVERAGDRARLTRRGKMLADSVAEAFV
jgi:oxygen-independent coproporphyrinogen-3 oxidase